jgi:CRISPR/Cas system-associated exonuclease Cas4 (RecB family)
MSIAATFGRLEGVGESSVFRGDPRLSIAGADDWWNSLLSTTEPPSQRPYLYGADAGMCARKNVFHANNTWVPFDKTPASIGYMAIGDALENMLAKGLSDKGKLVAQNMRLVDMALLKISGKMDLIFSDNNDELRLAEIKSCGALPSEPKINHLAQVEMYAAVSGFDRVWLTYVSRNVRNSFGPKISMKTFEVAVTPDVIRTRFEIAALSMLASKHGKLPPKAAHFRKSQECLYCPFLDFCWGKVESGLPEMSLETYAKFVNAASKVAEVLIKKRPTRYVRTLKACDKLLESGPLKDIVLEELAATRLMIASML